MTQDEMSAKTLERLARIEAELADVKRQLATEHSAGSQRGLDQHRIGERVATLEATMRHVERSIDALSGRVALSAGGAVSGAGISGILLYMILSQGVGQ